MVLGLIDFLLGGKKKNKLPKGAQVVSPVSTATQPSGPVQPAAVQPQPAQNLPDGVQKPTENASDEVKFEDSNEDKKDAQQPLPAANKATNPVDSGAPQQKKSVSEVIGKINSELKSSTERLTGLVTDFKEIENTVNTLGHKVDELEETQKKTNEKLSQIDGNMTKFLSLYELINNQYNPFVDKDDIVKPLERPIEIDAAGTTINSTSEDGTEGENKLDESASSQESSPISDSTFDVSELDVLKPEKSVAIDSSSNDLDSVFLELDTLNLDEAAGDVVPLKQLKNNTNSLVVILSWLEYLIKRVGLEETRSSLRYYTEVLRWTTPEVFFELDKYLKGMRDKKVDDGNDTLDVKDHIVSLYFISKLNEKRLDEKLTKAVLQIIKH